MLELAGFRRFDFHPGLFAVEAIEHADDQRQEHAPAEPAGREKEGRAPRRHVGEPGQLIRRNARPAKVRDEKILDRPVDERGEIELPFLGGSQEETLRAFLLVGTRGRKPIGMQSATKRNQVPVAAREIDRADFSRVDFFGQRFLEERSCPLRCEQRRAAEEAATCFPHTFEQRLKICGRRGIDQHAARILLVEQLQEPGIKDAIAGENEGEVIFVRPFFLFGGAAKLEREPGAIVRRPGEMLRQRFRRGRKHRSLSLGQGAAIAGATAPATKPRTLRSALPGPRPG